MTPSSTSHIGCGRFGGHALAQYLPLHGSAAVELNQELGDEVARLTRLLTEEQEHSRALQGRCKEMRSQLDEAQAAQVWRGRRPVCMHTRGSTWASWPQMTANSTKERLQAVQAQLQASTDQVSVLRGPEYFDSCSR